MNKNWKLAIWLTVGLTIYTILVVSYANRIAKPEKPKPLPNKITKPKPKYKFKTAEIILTPKTLIKYQNGIWKEDLKLDWDNQTFDVYTRTEQFKNHYLGYNASTWVIKDANNNFKNYEGDMLAIKSDYDYQILRPFEAELDYNDQVIISKLLTAKDLIFNYDKLSIIKETIDLNRDGIRESIYVVTNAFTSDSASFNKIFGFVFVHDNNENIIIYENIKEIKDLYEVCFPKVQNILELGGKRHIILSCTYYSEIGYDHYIYKATESKFIPELSVLHHQ